MTTLQKITQAIKNLTPTAEWVLRGDQYEGIEWHSTDIEIPTKEAIETEIARIEQEHINTEYQRLRQYPSLGDQLDMLWHELNTSGNLSTSGTWFQTIQEVKNNNPK
jgi:uncharacterized protein YicC (UPF0701 family)